MSLKKEIKKIVEYQNSILPIQDKKSKEILDMIIDMIYNEYLEKKYDFSKYINIVLKQGSKNRNVKIYKSFSTEEVLCIYLKRLLDKTFHIKYPNRNVFMRGLFDIINSLKDMNDYTIYRFDFSDFFNSISSEFVFEKYIKEKLHDRYQIELLSKFVKDTGYAYAGLNTSNIICEIIARQFDDCLNEKLKDKGVIFYKRYIDDGLIILNQYMSESDCLEVLNDAINEIFHPHEGNRIRCCKTKLNTSKIKYIARRKLISSNIVDFDFLGYKFLINKDVNDKVTFKYGITTQKIEKYKKKLDLIVREYATSPNKDIELLRHQIKAFSHRTVYRVNRYKSMIWKNKGFISNYCELRNKIDALEPNTEKFLKNVIKDVFVENGICLPYFITIKNEKSGYNLYNNMKKYKTLLFDEHIGINTLTLEKMCKELDINTTKKTYNQLVREYLIKVKVGH